MAVRAVSEGSDKFNARVNAQRRDRVGHVALGAGRWARRTSPGHEILGNGRRLALDKLFFKSASALVPMFRRYAIKNP